MSHLGERILDFVFEELSAADMAEARTHVAQCAECASRVQQFQRTQSLLQAVPDVEPPRSAALVFERPRVGRRWSLRWLAPMAVAAALVLAVALAAPVRVQWQNSQLAIAFGGASVPDSSVVERQKLEIQQLQANYLYLESAYQKMERDLFENSSSIQVLASRRSAVEGD